MRHYASSKIETKTQKCKKVVDYKSTIKAGRDKLHPNGVSEETPNAPRKGRETINVQNKKSPVKVWLADCPFG